MNYHKNKSKLKSFTKGGKKYYTCLVRNYHVLKTPEEEIRQLLLYHLINNKGVPIKNIWVEGTLKNVFSDIDSNRRFDVIIYEDKKKPDKNEMEREVYVLFECKKAGDALLKAWKQVHEYNVDLAAGFVVITNGKDSIISFDNFEKNRLEFLSDLPHYKDIMKFSPAGLEFGYHDENGELISIK